MRQALLREAHERLAAADPYRRDLSEYTHAEILGAVLLLLEEAREDVAAERANVTALLSEPVRHLRAA
jgi:hypothetical protein